MVDVRIEGLTELIADLSRAESQAPREVQAIVKKAAQNIKDELNANLAASRHFKGAAGSVTYDEKVSLQNYGAEIGPDKGKRGGPLGNIAFFGTSKGGGTVDLDGPVRTESARFESELNKLAGRLL